MRELESKDIEDFCLLCKRKIEEPLSVFEKEREKNHLIDTIEEIDSNIKFLYEEMKFFEVEMNTLMKK
ncbi:MAG: hypothetical protein GF317_17670 [Candidatus Lokiarchaeota archaeon]|nr:hypothetical protein [Candidatus Lokiarchaeota archaeon]MBD3201343.1 hypothetical protein [Candidatus Lokiarchaeota archaeon]